MSGWQNEPFTLDLMAGEPKAFFRVNCQKWTLL
jgi:hypothetical protein